jgi:hypothetical protein
MTESLSELGCFTEQAADEGGHVRAGAGRGDIQPGESLWRERAGDGRRLEWGGVIPGCRRAVGKVNFVETRQKPGDPLHERGQFIVVKLLRSIRGLVVMRPVAAGEKEAQER